MQYFIYSWIKLFDTKYITCSTITLKFERKEGIYPFISFVTLQILFKSIFLIILFKDISILLFFYTLVWFDCSFSLFVTILKSPAITTDNFLLSPYNKYLFLKSSLSCIQRININLLPMFIAPLYIIFCYLP